MKLACNYSQPLMALIENKKIDVDKIKMAYFGPMMGLHDQVAQVRPLLLHGFGWHEHIGMSEPAKNNDWMLIEKMLERYDNEYLTVHFSVYEGDLGLGIRPRQALEKGLQVFTKAIDRPLMIENIDYNPKYSGRPSVLREAVEPDFIYEMCEKYDLALLLDTAHAGVSAWHMGMEVERYMEQLPLHRVKEVHFIGTQHNQELGVHDNHTALEDKDYKLMDWLLAKTAPEILTLEYGWPGKAFEWRTDEGAIYEQLTEIRRRYPL